MNKREEWPNENHYMDHYMCHQETPPFFPQTSNWVHIPPQTMPWGLPSTSHPPVVRFTGGGVIPQHHRMKRKSNSDFDLTPKQLVTEEKMAAHMSNLHISDVDMPRLKNDIEIPDETMELDRLPKLIISDEIKNMKSEPIIPESILNKIERPIMAVVLWQPPVNELARLSELKDNDEKEKEEKDENAMIVENNNVDNTFRPIDPVPMHPMPQNEFLQPTPQFQGFLTFS